MLPEVRVPQIYRDVPDRIGYPGIPHAEEYAQVDAEPTPKRLTPEFYMEQNQSLKAERLREEFKESKARGEMDYELNCADARIVRVNPAHTWADNTIANGGDPRRAGKLLQSPRTRSARVVAHDRCGGRAVRNWQLEHGMFYVPTPDSAGFVAQEIKHPSVAQAAIKAEQLSRMTNKEVTAWVLNTLTGERRPLAIFNRKDKGISHRLPQHIFDTRRPPSPLHDDEIEYLELDELSDTERERAEEYNKAKDALFAANPELSRKLGVQNPGAIKYSLGMRGAEILFPDTLPGDIFRVTGPRQRFEENGQKKTDVHPASLREAWRQAHYPIAEALAHREVPNTPFRDTNTFLVITPDYRLSIKIALDLVQQPFMIPWVNQEQTNIIVMQENSGKVRIAGEFVPKMRNGYAAEYKIENEVD